MSDHNSDREQGEAAAAIPEASDSVLRQLLREEEELLDYEESEHERQSPAAKQHTAQPMQNLDSCQPVQDSPVTPVHKSCVRKQIIFNLPPSSAEGTKMYATVPLDTVGELPDRSTRRPARARDTNSSRSRSPKRSSDASMDTGSPSAPAADLIARSCPRERPLRPSSIDCDSTVNKRQKVSAAQQPDAVYKRHSRGERGPGKKRKAHVQPSQVRQPQQPGNKQGKVYVQPTLQSRNPPDMSYMHHAPWHQSELHYAMPGPQHLQHLSHPDPYFYHHGPSHPPYQHSAPQPQHYQGTQEHAAPPCPQIPY
eukprot:jgi/Chrzof1/2825/Cz12g00070.t1